MVRYYALQTPETLDVDKKYKDEVSTLFHWMDGYALRLRLFEEGETAGIKLLIVDLSVSDKIAFTCENFLELHRGNDVNSIFNLGTRIIGALFELAHERLVLMGIDPRILLFAMSNYS
ncbi:unnamed protein product [Sphenostylis stenocarpa]|uniref:Uncharacterized protein n=1 Tax=Sphenostylis stenocarpa TaxID=92480 RepID=A0AA86S890_9FABA|nr:unnamed protein product [Sphenostylis stenocarpa]